MVKHDNKRAVIYSRYSTDNQTESTIADQERICGEYAEREGLHIVAKFKDEAISGAAMGNRPGLLKMQEASLRRAFDTLLVADLSRLSRNQGDLPKIIERLTSKKIRVVGVQDGFDSSRKGSKLQSGLTGVISEAFRDMVREKTFSALESRAKNRKPTGGKAYGYNDRAIVLDQAKVVRQIFELYADGKGMRAIAGTLNKKHVPSPGATWKRKTRRSEGWMCSTVRVILRNPIYRGEVIWNKTQWTKDGDTGVRKCEVNPESQWIRQRFDDMRIVSDELWSRVQRRIGEKQTAETGKRKRGGGKSRFVLSGLLVCGDCGSNFILADSRAYACSGHIGGQVCQNKLRLPRKLVEQKLLRPIYDQLLSKTARAAGIAELERNYTEQTKRSKSAPTPQAIQELDARITKMRARLKAGDPDMTAEDIQVVIERLERQRADAVKHAQPLRREHIEAAKIEYTKAAELFEQEIAGGLAGASLEVVARARVVLRSLLGGAVRLERGSLPGSLYANFKLQRIALLEGRRLCGSGGRI